MDKRRKRKRLKTKQRKKLALLAVIMLLLVAAAVVLLTPAFNVVHIVVSGNAMISDEDIIKSSGILKDVSIFGVSTSQAEDMIEQMSYIDEATVSRDLPGTIHIKVVETVGVACIKAMGGYLVIATDGRALELVTKTRSEMPYPVVEGLRNVTYKIGEQISADNKQQLNALFECLKEFSKQRRISNMNTIDVSNTDNIEFSYNNERLLVSVGDISRLEYKMQCFNSILKEIGINPEGYVDLKRMVYRRSKERAKAKSEE